MGLGLIFAFIYHSQLNEMQSSGAQTDRLINLARGQAAQLTQQTKETHDLAVAAGNQASAAKTSAETEQRVLQSTIDNFRLDQRAWLSVSSVDPVVQVGRPLTFTLHLKNTGKTFAENINEHIVSEVVKGTDRPSPSEHFPLRRTHISLAPGAELLPFKNNSTTGGGKLLERDMAALIDKTVVIFLHGDIAYDDVFGRHHKTPVCFVLASDPTGMVLRACQLGQTPNYGDPT